MSDQIFKTRIVTLVSCLVIGACATYDDSISYLPLSNADNLPKPNITTHIQGLSNCTHKESELLKLNSNQPVTVIVHGCFSSAGKFRTLADVYAFHGQQTVCFNYDDRERLTTSADQLTTALEQLSKVLNQQKIVVIGHSQGGLIARRAMSEQKQTSHSLTDNKIELVTISSPFAGIEAASHCGSTTLAWLSLGLTKPICHLITGSKYKDITANSEFITQPGRLDPIVSNHLKIVTDETDTCRVYDKDSQCIEDDFVFSVEEQNQNIVDTQPAVTPLLVRAGHVEIVGNSKTVPIKLIEILQRQGLLNSTPEEQQAELAKLLTHLYLAH